MNDPDSTGPGVETLNFAHGDVSFRTAGAGPALLVLHHDVGPFGWTTLHEDLARNYRVTALDLPGFGESARADWARHPRDIAALVLSAARRLRIRDYHLVGLGFGGWVAAEMAAFSYPELAALTLIAPAGLRPDEGFILDQVLEEPVAYLRAGFSSAELFDEYFPDAKDRALRERLDRARETIARLCWKPYMYSYELPETLRQVDLPVTVVWSDDDRVVPPPTADRWASTLPRCELRTLSAAGHFIDLERPAELASIVRAAATSSRQEA